ncbi:hypothetical protein [Pseudothermotoga sp.]
MRKSWKNCLKNPKTTGSCRNRMNTFSKIKEYSVMKSMPMNDRTLTNVLRSLVRYSYLEERFEDGSNVT